MSIINDALKKARETRDSNIRGPKTSPGALVKEEAWRKRPKAPSPAEEEAHREKPGVETAVHSVQRTGVSGGEEKFIPRQTLYIIGSVILISLVLFLLIRQNVDYTINRTLTVQEKDSTPVEPLKSISPRIPVEDRGTGPVEGPSPGPLQPPEFVITGIVSDKDFPMAIINGNVYMVGDKINEAKILEISEDVVVLEKGGERLELKVSYR